MAKAKVKFELENEKDYSNARMINFAGFVDHLSSQCGKEDFTHVLPTPEFRPVIVRLAAEEIVNCPNDGLYNTIVPIYLSDPQRFAEYLPGDKDIVITKDRIGYEQVYAVLMEAMVLGADAANGIASVYTAHMTQRMDRLSKDIAREVKRSFAKQDPAIANPATGIRKTIIRFFFEKGASGYFAMTRYVYSLVCQQAAWVRIFVKEAMENNGSDLAYAKMFVGLGRAQTSGGMSAGDPDNIYVGKACQKNPLLKDISRLLAERLNLANPKLCATYYMISNISCLSGMEEWVGYLPKMSNDDAETVTDETNIQDALSCVVISTLMCKVAEMGLDSVSLSSLVHQCKLSEKDVRTVVVKADAFARQCFHIYGDDFFPDKPFYEVFSEEGSRIYLVLLASKIVDGLYERLILGACSSIEKQNREKTPSASDEVMENLRKEMLSKINDLELALNKKSDLLQSMEKKAAEKERRVKEQEKIIKRLEKELSDERKKDSESDKKADACSDANPDEPVSNDEVVETDEEFEEAPSLEMSDEELKRYFEMILGETSIYVYGARANFESRMSKMYPSLKFMDCKTATPASLERADMIILRIEHVGHSEYGKVRDMAKRSGKPFRYMEKKAFNERRFYETVVDIYENN